MATDVIPEQLSEPARAFVGGDHRFVIGEERPVAADGRTFAVEDPSTGLTIAQVPQGGPADVDAAVAAARAAFEGPWRTLPAIKRGRLIARLAELIAENGDQLAELESLDNGKPVKFAKFVDVAETVAYLEYYAGWPTKIEGDVYPHGDPNTLAYSRREPVGVCAQIVPWNYPLLMAAWKIGPALAAGCTIVLNRAARDLVLRNLPCECCMHDWWIYLLVLSKGRVFYDSHAGILYRQHGGNNVGYDHHLGRHVLVDARVPHLGHWRHQRLRLHVPRRRRRGYVLVDLRGRTDHRMDRPSVLRSANGCTAQESHPHQGSETRRRCGLTQLPSSR